MGPKKARVIWSIEADGVCGHVIRAEAIGISGFSFFRCLDCSRIIFNKTDEMDDMDDENDAMYLKEGYIRSIDRVYDCDKFLGHEASARRGRFLTIRLRNNKAAHDLRRNSSSF